MAEPKQESILQVGNEFAKKQISDFLDGVTFAACVVELTKLETTDWVKMRSDPPRFQPKIFIGAWADPNSHPTPGELRILRIMTGPDKVTRAIARQGKYLFCYPWM